MHTYVLRACIQILVSFLEVETDSKFNDECREFFLICKLFGNFFFYAFT